jgi:hypothetical protein
MTMRVRNGLVLMLALAIMGLASCGHYTCGANFGSSTCSAGTVGLTGGSGGSADAAYAFVLNGTGVGAMEGYTLDTSVTPPTLSATSDYTPPTTPSDDAGIGMVVAQKQFLYTAFTSTGQIYGWTISSTGILTAIAGSPFSVAPILSAGTTDFDVQRVATNPAGTLLFVADEFGNQIFVYQIGSGGVLTAVSGSPFFVGFPAGNMTTDGLGSYLYIADDSGAHTGFEIGAYSIGTGSNLGVLTAVAGTPFASTNFDMWQVQGEPTGKYLIGTKGLSMAVGNGSDDDNLYVFTIGPTGAPSAPVLFPTTNSPFNIAVQSNAGGNLVDTFGLADSDLAFNPVESYSISTTGTLSVISGSPFLTANVGSAGQFDQTGDLLFIYGGVVNGNTVVYTLTSFDVASGSLTTPTATGTYGGYWVVTDPN